MKRPSTRRITGLTIGLSLAASAVAASAVAIAPAQASTATASIVGHVTTTPMPGTNYTPSISTGLDVWLYTADNVFVADTVTNPQGDYTFANLPAGDYKIRFENQNEGVEEYYHNTTTLEGATAIPVGKGQRVEANAHLSGASENTVKPTVSGTAAVGQTLTSTDGSWWPPVTGSGFTVTREWLRDGTPISGATGTSYTLTNADAGARIQVRVIVSRDGMHEAGVSLPTAAVTGGTSTPQTPAVSVVSAPVLSGTATVGSTLTVSNGTWQPTTATVTRQWLRNGTPISGATGTSYTLTSADAGATISVRLTASAAGHTDATATSNTVAVAGSPSTTPAPTVHTAPRVGGLAAVGGSLSATAGTWTGTVTSTAYAWLRDGTPIAGATSATYVPVAADAGAALSVRVTATGPGGSTSSTSAAVTVDKATSAAKLTLAGGKGKVKATLKLTSAGKKSGKVTFSIKVGKKSITKTVKVKGGKATATLKVAKGKHKVTASYAGDKSTYSAKVSKKATVR